MTLEDYHIIPYTEEYNQKVYQLEKGIVQGSHIQLEIIKKNFLDRANVFKINYSCIALTKKKEVIASAIGAQTTISINGIQSRAGIAFDTKVDPAWRNNGIGRMMAKDIYMKFFLPQGLSKNFMVAKRSNARVVKMAAHAVPGIWFYDFVYLTIPAIGRIKPLVPMRDMPQQFNVQLFNKEDLSEEYYTRMDNGLCYFNTYKVYMLKIKKISWLYKQGIKFLKKKQPSKYASLPGENDMFSFVTLYNHNPQNIHRINEVLQNLESIGVKQLMVCCRRNDHVFNTLKKISINQYDYNIVSDFSLNFNDKVIIDARCL